MTLIGVSWKRSVPELTGVQNFYLFLKVHKMLYKTNSDFLIEHANIT